MSILNTGFYYDIHVRNPDGSEYSIPRQYNLLPQEGLNHIAGLIRGTVVASANWYNGIYESNYVPTSAITSAQLTSVAGESTAYASATRPAWDHAFDGVTTISNTASTSSFVMTSAKTIYGAFIHNSPTKGGTSGVLLSIARFSTPLVLVQGATLTLTAGVVISST